MNKKVSIITIVYNGEKHLEQTIQSVLKQTYTNIEYIIVDGGSTDSTLQIIGKYENRISKIISEPDKGIGDAFNKGLSLATGDIIGIINADDWYASDAIETIIKSTTKADVYCGNIQLVNASGHVTRTRKSKVEWLNFGMYIMHPSVFVGKHVYDKVGKFDTSYKIAMDFDMMLRIKNMKFQFLYIDKNIASMRTTGISKDVEKMHKEELVVMKRNLNWLNFSISFLVNYLNRGISTLKASRGQ